MNCPDIVTYKIFYYLWKLRIKAVNNQYSSKFYDHYGSLSYVVLHNGLKYSMFINYRTSTGFTNTFSSMIHKFHSIFETNIHVPLCYFYSSGMNCPHGYKHDNT